MHLATPPTEPDDRAAVPALRVSGVARTFGATIAVDGVSLELAPRELLALVGPSGCGKSTLLRMLAGLTPTERGSIELAGTVVDDGHDAWPPERRRVGLVFQEHALFPHLSVADNVGFGVRGTRAAIADRVAEMLAVVGLDRYGARFPHELSGGERQRVALARALAPEPVLLLLDEPFASLDPNLRGRLRDDVATILRATGTPAVFVTHDQAEAMAVGDRIAVMRDGRIAQIGTPEAVFHEPLDRFVAAFMGEADVLTEVGLASLAAEVVVPPGSVAMVRPDDVTFGDVELGDVELGEVAAAVVGAEFRGSEWCYRLRLGDGSIVRSTRPHLDRVAVGATVAPRLRAGHRPMLVAD